MNKEDIITKLRELKPVISARYKTKEIGLFGSFVRGEQNEGSDVDILAEFDDDADLFDLMGLSIYLEDIFQCNIDANKRTGIYFYTRSLKALSFFSLPLKNSPPLSTRILILSLILFNLIHRITMWTCYNKVDKELRKY